MKVLVLGNGFDLYHALNTKYTDFLTFINLFLKCAWHEAPSFNDTLENENISEKTKLLLNKILNKETDGDIEELINLTNLEADHYPRENYWFNYFNEINSKEKDRWIDFEEEISSQMSSLCNFYNMYGGKKYKSLDQNAKKYFDEIHRLCYVNYYHKNDFILDHQYFKKMSERFSDDLTKFIRCFEIYLVNCVNKEQVNKDSLFLNTHFDKVLSFNYSNTYERIYKPYFISKGKNIDCEYIHGKAEENNSLLNNNMVLGCEQQESDLYIYMQKPFQRINNGSKYEYKKWIQQMSNSDRSQIVHEVIFFGHSFGRIDSDIISEFLSCSGVKSIIYFHSKKSKADINKNLMNILGKEIFESYISDKRIKYKSINDD